MSNGLKLKEEFNQEENKTNTPDECIIYWDFDSIPISNGQQLRNITNSLTQKIRDKIGSKPIQLRIYSCMTKLSRKLQDDFDINGIQHIITSSTIIDSVNKRILIDISYKLYELQKYKKSNCIALISNNDTFAHLLSRIRNEPPISHTLLISLNSNTQINPNLTNNVDFVITHSINNNRKRLNRDYDKNTNTSSIPKRQKTDNTIENGILINIKEFGESNGIQMTVDPTQKIKVFRQHLLNSELKLCLKNKYGITPSKYGTLDLSDFGLLFNGIRLVNKKKMHKYGIYEGNTVLWYLGSVHSIKVTVKALDICYCKEFTFKLCDKVYNKKIKKDIISEIGNGNNSFDVQNEDISLWWKGCELKRNKTTLIRYGVCNGDVIMCCLNNGNKMRAKDMSMENVIKCENTNNSIKEYESENEDSDIQIIDDEMFQKNMKKEVDHVGIKNVKMPHLENVSDRE
eukprot:441193_1